MRIRKGATAGMASRILRALVIVSTVIQTASAIPSSKIASDTGCDRTALLAVADAYVAAQIAGTLDSLKSVLAANWTYQENNKEADASKSVLSKALKIDHRQTNVDTTFCATYTELIIANSANPYVIGTQIHHNPADTKVKLIDSIVSTTNSWLFDAKKTLQHVLEEKWDLIPEGKRDSRAVIQVAGDAYMDMWSNSTSADAVPWGTPCTRLEGSQYTGKGKPDDSCKPGIPSNHNQKPNVDRRYVVDESMGSVSIFCVWEHMMNASDSHEFRLEGGKLRFVHTMTVCGGQVCKL
ncbi:uncharacterized protein PAC_04635 [Phialocephala subalpina]|uniref:DUF8021 domain-containing protein n=1 Tax=Phialocephala subalpina TaxID=576137 RepID=A0A1L7WPU4_9HELO|nr:uncharacterized protein PAC_04635 [Phialocephala subalpina]